MRNIRKALSFDDVLLEPSYSTIHPTQVDISTKIGGITLRLPIFSAAMDTLTGIEMAKALGGCGGCGVIHKNMSIDEQCSIVHELAMQRVRSTNSFAFGAAIGVGEMDRFIALFKHNPDFIVIDAAHGDTKAMFDFFGEIKEELRHANAWDPYKIVIGNISTRFAAYSLYKVGARVIKVGQGSGCLASGTRILMADGTRKNIEEVSVGDLVINGLGKMDEVVGTKFSGVRECIEYRTDKSHNSTYCTGDHKHMSVLSSDINRRALRDVGYRKVGKKFVKWNNLESLDLESLMTLPQNIDLLDIGPFEIDLAKYSLDNSRTKEYTKLRPSYDVGYLFGSFLGYGCASIVKGTRKIGKGANTIRKSWKTTTNNLSWYLDQRNPYLVGKLTQVLDRLGFKFRVHNSTKTQLTIVNVYSSSLCRFLSSFGKIQTKHLPDKYWCSESMYLKGILDGLVGTDGSIDNRKVNLHTTSHQLVELYQHLNLRINGVIPSVDIQKKSINKKRPDIVSKLPSYRVRYSKSMNTTRLTTSGYRILKIKKFTNGSKLLPTYDIQLRNNPSFIANNCIVHNSICSTRVVAGIGVPQLQAILDIAEMRDKENIHDLHIIADGGLRYSGDIVKALAAGADAVMLGSMLAGTDEALGGDDYRGMGSIPAMEAGSANRYNQAGAKKFTPEGVEGKVHKKGMISDVLKQIEGGIRAGMGYTGSHNLDQLRESDFVEITSSGLKESHPHSLVSIKSAPNYQI